MQSNEVSKNRIGNEASGDFNRVLFSLEYYLRRSGISYLPACNSAPPVELPSESLAEPRSDIIQSGTDKNTLLNILKENASSCIRCRLSEQRTKVVFEDGNRNRPLIAFVGEGPGEEEDRSGIPFVGKAGQLLTAAITKGLRLRREDVYICNVVKCRPPENRAPLPDEVGACSEYLFEQLKLVSPQIIVTLGGPAQKALVGREEGITKIRGQWLEWNGIKVMPTVHPAYVLRNPVAKKDFWADLQLVMKELDLTW